MKKIVIFLGLISILVFNGKTFSQAAFIGPNHSMYRLTDCSAGIIEDGGNVNNGCGFDCGYGWGRYVMKLSPWAVSGLSYPYIINQICIGLTRTTGSANWTFNIDIFDTTGEYGGPGVLVDSFNVTATGIGVWPSWTLYTFSNLNGIPTLTHGSYYIGISYDPCYTGNNGTQYLAIDENPPTYIVYQYIEGVWTNMEAYQWTGSLIVRAEQVPVGIHQNSSEVIKDYKLYNNYPNPFNPATLIKFDILKSGYVKLVVYNLIGQVVITLADGEFQAGSYSVNWDASNYSSGVYFYKIEAGNFTHTKKMVLIK